MVDTAGSLSLDFSTEPGLLNQDGILLGISDPLWASKPSPIAQIIESIFQFFENGKEEPRLTIGPALLGNQLLDEIVESYVDHQIGLLARVISKDNPEESDASRYAMTEAQSIAKRFGADYGQAHPLVRLANASFMGKYLDGNST